MGQKKGVASKLRMAWNSTLRAVDTSLVVFSMFPKSVDAQGYIFRFFSEKEIKRCGPGSLEKAHGDRDKN